MNGTFHIAVAMKPLHGNFSKNAVIHGVAGLNIEGCRIGTDARHNSSASANKIYGQFKGREDEGREVEGRWPANILHDGNDEVVNAFPGASMTGKRSEESRTTKVAGTEWLLDNHKSREYPGETGSAARFFKQIDEFKEEDADECVCDRK